jgi:NADH-quinone oxidoreductase subunit J
MTAEQIIFLIVGAATLVSALMVVTARDLVHAALWLVAALFGVAVVYTLLNAGFLAVVQVVVYIGAIAILFIFAVMLTRRQSAADTGPGLNKNWWLGAILAVVTFAGLVSLLRTWSGFSKTASAIPSGFDAVNQLGVTLTSPQGYVLPFEVASALLLAALVGAVYLAFTRK